MTRPASAVLRSLHRYAAAQQLPPPAALIGDWWDAEAVIAPSLRLQPGLAPPDDPDRFWLGHLGFPVGSDQAALPSVVGGLTDAVLLRRGGRWEYRDLTGARCPDWVGRALTDPPPAPAPATATWVPPEPEPHLAAIAAAQAAIRAGEIYQVCLCTHFTGRLDGAPVDFYADLAGRTTPAKSAFLQGDWGAVASFSPESFLRRRDTTVTSSPIKGTLPGGADPATLRTSAKDIAENVMITDLVRNDLGRVAEFGSVTVPELLATVPAPGVWHLVSTVAARLDPKVGNDALLAAAFPPASVTGCPKIRAAELLADWEPEPRGVYCGAIGMAGPGRELDLSVAIRTVQITPDRRLSLGVGGGITIDSDPAREWQECLDKAASIVGA